jgi:N-acetylglucosaminyldiphosphoundecaprenol N-acetyl-beta-D-mannosaminyltransferase
MSPVIPQYSEALETDDRPACLPVSGHRSLWPPRLNLIGVPVSCTNYDETVGCIVSAARERRPALVTAFAAHGVTIASDDAEFRQKICDFKLVAPDGQAVRLALNLLHRARLRETDLRQ